MCADGAKEQANVFKPDHLGKEFFSKRFATQSHFYPSASRGDPHRQIQSGQAHREYEEKVVSRGTSKRHPKAEEEGGEKQGIFLEEFEISESDSITSSQAKGAKFRNTHYGGADMYYQLSQAEVIEEKAKQIMKSNLNNNSKFERTSSYNENHMSSTLTHFYKRNQGGAQPEQPFPALCSKTGTNFRQQFATEEQKPEVTQSLGTRRVGVAGEAGAAAERTAAADYDFRRGLRGKPVAAEQEHGAERD